MLQKWLFIGNKMFVMTANVTQQYLYLEIAIMTRQEVSKLKLCESITKKVK